MLLSISWSSKQKRGMIKFSSFITKATTGLLSVRVHNTFKTEISRHCSNCILLTQVSNAAWCKNNSFLISYWRRPCNADRAQRALRSGGRFMVSAGSCTCRHNRRLRGGGVRVANKSSWLIATNACNQVNSYQYPMCWPHLHYLGAWESRSGIYSCLIALWSIMGYFVFSMVNSTTVKIYTWNV